MVEGFEPIRLYLEEKLDIPIEVIVMDNYVSLSKENEEGND